MGVSGGSDGALYGPSIMPGGDLEAWQRLRPALEAIAARSDSGVCVTYCGRGSAGHLWMGSESRCHAAGPLSCQGSASGFG